MWPAMSSLRYPLSKPRSENFTSLDNGLTGRNDSAEHVIWNNMNYHTVLDKKMHNKFNSKINK